MLSVDEQKMIPDEIEERVLTEKKERCRVYKN